MTSDPSLPPPLAPDESSVAPGPTPLPVAKSRQAHPATIRHSQSFEPAKQSPRTSLVDHYPNPSSRSTTSLDLLSSSAPTQAHQSNLASHTSPTSPTSPSESAWASQEYEQRSQVPPLRPSAFSNPFKKLQNTFGSSGKKSMDHNGTSDLPPSGGQVNSGQYHHQYTTSKGPKVVSSSSSANSLTSWRSKGAEMLSKTAWSRTRKNSEPLLGSGPRAIPATPVFGAHLEDAVRTSHIPGTAMVPAVLYRCAVFLEVKGVDEVGLYRVPGSHANVQRLKLMFDSGRDLDLLAMNAKDPIDPNDIATLLKLYLRELPAPLLSPPLLEQFQSLLSTDKHICHTLRGILIRLPRPNYVVLSYLCHHLSRIAAHSEKTKMTVSNLGVVFAPTLSIGSVLFKALLGGFHEGPDTPENREKGLKIVWGGLLQDMDYNTSGWQEDDPDQGDQEAHPLHQQEQSRRSVPPPLTLPLKPQFIDNPFQSPTRDVGPLSMSPGSNNNHLKDSFRQGPPHPFDSEESRLMTSMLQQEDNAVKQHSALSPSHLTHAAGTTGHTTSTSTNTGAGHSHSTLNPAKSSGPTHVTIQASTGGSSLPMGQFLTGGNVSGQRSPSNSGHYPHTSASGAPQLPPLEEFMVAL